MLSVIEIYISNPETGASGHNRTSLSLPLELDKFTDDVKEFLTAHLAVLVEDAARKCQADETTIQAEELALALRTAPAEVPDEVPGATEVLPMVAVPIPQLAATTEVPANV